VFRNSFFAGNTSAIWNESSTAKNEFLNTRPLGYLRGRSQKPLGEKLEDIAEFASRARRMAMEEKVEFFDIRAAWDEYNERLSVEQLSQLLANGWDSFCEELGQLFYNRVARETSSEKVT